MSTATKFTYAVATAVAPSDVTVVSGNGAVNVKWSAVSGTSSYRIFRSTSADQFGTSMGTTTNLSYFDSTVTNGLNYYYRVVSRSSSGSESSPSTAVLATPMSISKTNHCGTISVNEIWDSTAVHVLTCPVTVAAGITLTIQPGSVVKPQLSTATFTIHGSLSAVGAVGSPVVFTSYRDDTYGGDVNGDADTTVPAAGNWAGISVLRLGVGLAPLVVLDRVVVRFGWSGLSASLAGDSLSPLWVASPLVVTNSVFESYQNWAVYVASSSDVTFTGNTVSGSSYGVDINVHGSSSSSDVAVSNVVVSNNTVSSMYARALDVSQWSDDGSLTVSGNTVTGVSNGGGVSVSSSTGSGPLSLVEPVVSGNVVTATQGVAVAVNADRLVPANLTGNTGSVNTIRVLALSGVLVADLVLPTANLPVAIGVRPLTVSSGVSMTVAAGTVVKSFGGGLEIRGSLSATGTAGSPVVFTSYRDDTYGGDTNRDTTATVPAAGNWAGISASVGGTVSAVATYIHYASLALGSSDAIVTFRGKITNNSYGASGSQFGVIDASGVDWGTPSGPAPYGTGDTVNQYVIVQPWIGQVSFRARYFGSGFRSSSWAGSSSGSYGYGSSRRSAGDPVDVATGNFSLALTDIVVAEPGLDLAFARAYSAQSFHVGVLGPKWTSSWETRLVLPAQTDIGSYDVYWGDGRVDSYTIGPSGLVAQPGNYTKLVAVAGGFQATTKDRAVYTFDASGGLASVADIHGNTFTVGHDAESRVTSVTDGAGRQMTFVYSATRLTGVTGPDGRSVTFGYDAGGRLIKVTDQSGKFVTYSYDDDDRLLEAFDANGHLDVSNQYDLQHRVVRQLDALGNVTTFTYGSSSTTKRDPKGRNRTYTFDVEGKVLSETDEAGYVVTTTYDAAGRPLARSDSFGTIESFTYDARGNVLTHRDGALRGLTSTYSAEDLMLTTKDATNATTTYTYNATRNPVTVTDPLGNVTAMGHNSAGQLITSTSPLGGVTTNVYNARGDVTSVTKPGGAATTMTYDSMGRMMTSTDPLGGVTAMTYDLVGRTLSVTAPSAGTTSRTYDVVGNVLTETNATGHTITSTYTDNDQLATVTDPAGGTLSYEYDLNGNLVKVTDQMGAITLYGYDNVNRQIALRNPVNATETVAYDGRGRVITETTALGHATMYEYDLSNLVLRVTDPLANVTTSVYNLAGRLTRTTDAKLHNWNNAYDPLGRIVSRTTPLGQAWTYGYDADGRMVTETDPAGASRTYGYDISGRRASAGYPDGSSVTYTYDANDRLVGRTEPSGSFTFAYDTAGRLTSSTDALGQVTAFTYNVNGQQTSRTVAGVTTSFSYDSRGNRTGATDAAGNATWTYDAANTLVAGALPGTVTLVVVNDTAHRPTQRTYTRAAVTLFTATISYDAAGRPVTMTDPTGAHTYAYDTAGQLLSDTVGGVATTYTYDKVGNRTQIKVGAAAATTATYDNADRLVSNGTTTYTYDTLGRPQTSATGGVTTTYEWNPNGYLTELAVGAVTTGYVVDDSGIVLSEQTGATSIMYNYDRTREGWPLLSSTTNAVVQRILEGVDVYGTRTGAVTTTFLTDHMGSKRGSVTAAGAITPRAFDAWGATIGAPGNTGDLGFARGTVANSGLIRFGQRFYDPTIGRFLTPERNFLREDDARLSMYTYATNSPVLLSDPSGLMSFGFDQIRGYVSTVKTILTPPSWVNSTAKTLKKATSWMGNKLSWVNAIGDVWGATGGYKSTSSGSASTSSASESSRDSTCYNDINFGGAHVSSSYLRSLDAGSAGTAAGVQNYLSGYQSVVSFGSAGGNFLSSFYGLISKPITVTPGLVSAGANLGTAARNTHNTINGSGCG